MDHSVLSVSERRHSTRTGAGDVPAILQVRVRPGHEAQLVDISQHGALIETVLRLLPGRVVELQFERSEHVATVRGRVVRCKVARLQPAMVAYRGAIGFEKPLAWLGAAHREYAVPKGPDRDSRTA